MQILREWEDLISAAISIDILGINEIETRTHRWLGTMY